jgi:hypothetical protein
VSVAVTVYHAELKPTPHSAARSNSRNGIARARVTPALSTKLSKTTHAIGLGSGGRLPGRFRPGAPRSYRTCNL